MASLSGFQLYQPQGQSPYPYPFVIGRSSETTLYVLPELIDEPVANGIEVLGHIDPGEGFNGDVQAHSGVAYLATIGVQAALLRRATEGGSYKVTVTLAQTVMFEQAIGLVDKNTLLDLENMGEEHQPLEPNLQTGQTALGEFTRLGSQIEMSKTPEYWADPIIHPIGSSKPEWLPRMGPRR